MAIVVGMVGVVVVGMGFRTESLSAASLVQLLLVAVLLRPVYRLEPLRPGVAGRVRGWFRSSRAPIAVAAALLAGARLPFAPEPLAALVYLPFARTAGFFFGVELFYRPYVGFDPGSSSVGSASGT